jgi:2-oxoisovalerate dehydrogenase E2 component (dihydrolipoyl transacylase)
MQFEVTLPQLGDEEDTVTVVKASQWLAHTGDVVAEGDDLLEIVTDKAAFVLPAPKSGKVIDCCLVEGDTVSVGETVCVLEIRPEE